MESNTNGTNRFIESHTADIIPAKTVYATISSDYLCLKLIAPVGKVFYVKTAKPGRMYLFVALSVYSRFHCR